MKIMTIAIFSTIVATVTTERFCTQVLSLFYYIVLENISKKTKYSSEINHENIIDLIARVIDKARRFSLSQ